MKLTVIGCSGSFPGPDSAASCYLVSATDAEGRDWNLLLDLGNGSLGPLQRVLDPLSVDAVLLSHLHGDHMLDIAPLYVVLKYHPVHTRVEPMSIYGPEGTRDRIIGAAGPSTDDVELDRIYSVQAWVPDRAAEIGPFVVTASAVRHPVEAYALRVEGPSSSGGSAVITYSGDTDSCDGLDTAANGCDLFVVESAFTDGRDELRGVHMTGARAGEAIARSGTPLALVTHVPPWTDAEFVVACARDAAADHGSQARIDLAKPGTVYLV